MLEQSFDELTEAMHRLYDTLLHNLRVMSWMLAIQILLQIVILILVL